MAGETVKRQVYYRRARFDPDGGQTLQQLLRAALKSQAKVKDRLESTDAEAKEFRFISHHRAEDSFICGRLTTFERGGFQMVIDDNPDAETLSLEALEPPKKNGVQQQYVPGGLYFVCHGNHVAVSQSLVLKTAALENHLVWLLRSKTNCLASDQGFVLKDEIQKATRERIRKSHVKSVQIGRPLMESESFVKKGGKPGTRYRAQGAIIEALKELFEDDKGFEKLGLEDEVFDTNLEVWIEVRHPKRARKRSTDAINMLDNLGIALRDIEEDRSRLRLTDGSLVHGKELRISANLLAESSKGMISESSLFTAMREWVRELIQTGMVTAD